MGKRTPFDPRLPDAQMEAATPAVGTMLRQARIRLGRDLPEVASILRIRLAYLQAMEDGRFADLPGTAYATGFMRSYAEYLGLDTDLVVRLYKEEAAGQARKQELYFPTPVPEGRVPGGTILLATLVLAGLVYGGWYYATATDRSMVDLVPMLPDRLVSLLDTLPWSSTTRPPPDGEDAETAALPPPPEAPAPAEPLTPVTPPPDAAVPIAPTPATSTPAAPAPAPAAPTQPSPSTATARPSAPPPAPPLPTPAPATATLPPAEDEPEVATQEPTPLLPGGAALPGTAQPAPPPLAAPVEPTTPTGRVYGSQNQTSRIQLRATQDSWIQVRDGNNDLLFTRVLRPGDVYRVPDRPGIRVRTGNAGGLIVVTDGIEGPPMGAVGQVLRDVPLDIPVTRPATSG